MAPTLLLTRYDGTVTQTNLKWQSKLVLLLVLPMAAASVVLQTHWWALNDAPVAIWAIGFSLLLGFVVLALHAATPGGAFAGAVITASLIFATLTFAPNETVSYAPWHTALVPVLAVALLAHFATRLGRTKKERLGTAEGRRGRTAAQVAANLGVAAIMSNEFVQIAMMDWSWLTSEGMPPQGIFTPMLAALAEAAADTVSSEIGQVGGGKPRMITTLRTVEPGTDGAVSLIGTLAGVVAAAIVAGVGTLALYGRDFQFEVFWVSTTGGVFGLLFDSLLGATLERRGWLNNDLVNFLSTASAAAFALAAMAALPLLR